MPQQRYEGCSLFRQRIVASALSGNMIRIDNIRSDEELSPGLQDFEANFLRLVEKLCDGCRLEINETGTTLRLKPGIITGGNIQHDCGISRSMGWFIEGILPLLVFGKTPLTVLQLTGITNDPKDLSVDTLRTVTLPLLKNFGVGESSLIVKRRGCFPKGGGELELRVPMARELQPINITEEGLVARVRGTAFCAKVSPSIINRTIEACRGVLNQLLPDVYINADHNRGQKSGLSAGYSLQLVAETTTGVLISTECTAGGPTAASTGEMPEDIGIQAANQLLEEIRRGGVIDSQHQPMVLMFMALGPEDVCKVRFGSELTPQSVRTLQLIRDAFGTVFKIKRDVEGEGTDKEKVTIVLSCLGIGYKNMSRRIV
jgi:RNA 3'-terminal phosphate cyclase-like protein